MMYDLKGHTRSNDKTTFSTFVYGQILMKICMNANIMKKYFFINVTFMLWRSYVIFSI